MNVSERFADCPESIVWSSFQVRTAFWDESTQETSARRSWDIDVGPQHHQPDGAVSRAGSFRTGRCRDVVDRVRRTLCRERRFSTDRNQSRFHYPTGSGWPARQPTPSSLPTRIANRFRRSAESPTTSKAVATDRQPATVLSSLGSYLRQCRFEHTVPRRWQYQGVASLIAGERCQ